MVNLHFFFVSSAWNNCACRTHILIAKFQSNSFDGDRFEMVVVSRIQEEANVDYMLVVFQVGHSHVQVLYRYVILEGLEDLKKY